MPTPSSLLIGQSIGLHRPRSARYAIIISDESVEIHPERMCLSVRAYSPPQRFNLRNKDFRNSHRYALANLNHIFEQNRFYPKAKGQILLFLGFIIRAT